jgi:Ca2+-binding EF-hand superfamily protein
MKKILLVVTIILVSASMVLAQDDAYLKLDKNKDSKISKKEYMDTAAEKFEKLDKNQDGILTSEEITSGSNVDAQKLIKEIDSNGEGKITKKMYLQAAEKQFISMDKNKDDYIEIKEWKIVRSLKNPPALVIFTF